MKDDILRKELEEDGIRILGYSRYDRLEDDYIFQVQASGRQDRRKTVNHVRKYTKTNPRSFHRGK